MYSEKTYGKDGKVTKTKTYNKQGKAEKYNKTIERRVYKESGITAFGWLFYNRRNRDEL